MTEYNLRTPLDDETISKLKAGDIIYLSGTVFTARDEAHMELLKHGDIPGLDMTGLGLYHCGPVMQQENGKWNIISAGPTTSFRMETLEPAFLDKFKVKLIIGKGGMGPLTLESLKKHNVAYVSFTGGAGALAAKGLGEVKAVYYLEELGMPEAVWVFEAKNFGPLIVSMDSKGHSLYDDVNSKTRKNLERLLKE
ncbi:MAG: FumA C-terminus/TtdB family hydratase beta subunit [Candidatus Thermoplasmatota archaeon]|nr:fumarate hydratase [Euryarchaeota archaeon]MBU4032286.1 FumA C-terminus/TtdB family hydratase beta subunit [Candidatus Thermoplasmatota archaeon]MBU4072252.1 FumA C-terminus/TtdB family hydratase beta subunit [Candidatus Thermoplasmatota archaeon]MBU4144779.1 FumA C-terminus/TtdB family hydratase beta subunit [Candidatus Thermoplasmatota archaeon]MBU4591463.1 FumA C-terminus/TtdB family hydratase beta subunit [Candidatus Thermoplasmatota archaeon]